MTSSFTDQIPRGGLIISCQAAAGNPLRDPQLLALMARAGEQGGAIAVRANGADDVAAIRAVLSLPILGINKLGDPSAVFITPTAAAALEVVAAGASIIALDGTTRLRPDGLTFDQQVRRIRELSDVPLMADVDSLEAGLRAREAGADAVASTLSGYTGGAASDRADIELIADLAARLDCPVIAEGRIWTEADARAARDAGAYAVVVGTAITNPVAITRRFVRALNAQPAEALGER